MTGPIDESSVSGKFKITPLTSHEPGARFFQSSLATGQLPTTDYTKSTLHYISVSTLATAPLLRRIIVVNEFICQHILQKHGL